MPRDTSVLLLNKHALCNRNYEDILIEPYLNDIRKSIDNLPATILLST